MGNGDVKFNSGFNGCNDRIAILKNELVPRRLDEFKEISDGQQVKDGDFLYVDGEDRQGKKIKISTLLNPSRIQSNWNETNPESPAYILNKPGVDNLKEAMVSLYNVGGVKAGDVFPAGTSLNDIINKIFCLQGSGLFKHFITNIKPEDLDKSYIDNLGPEATTNLTGDILANGYQWNITTNNQYFYIALPEDSEFEVTTIKQGGWDIGFTEGEVEGYVIYYQDLPSKGTFPLTIFFNRKEEN